VQRKVNRREFLKGAGVVAIAPSIVAAGSRSGRRQPARDAGVASEPLVLWYDRPAASWTEALPIGNGRLGAMVFGGTALERIPLNEDTLHAGGPYDPNNPAALGALPEVRRLIFDGEFKKASERVGESMMARPIKQMPYEPVGDLLLEFSGHDAATDYRRELDLDTAVATTTYTVGGVRFERRVFSSPVDDVIVVHVTGDRPGQIAFRCGLATPQVATVATAAPDTLVLRGRNGEASGVPGALTFEARVRVLTRGVPAKHWFQVAVYAWLLRTDGTYERATVDDGMPVSAQARLLERYTSGREHAQP